MNRIKFSTVKKGYQIDEVEKYIDMLQACVTEMEEQIEKHEQQVEKGSKEAASIRSQQRTLEDQNQSLEKDKQSLKQNLDKKEMECRGLYQTIEEQDRKINELQSRVSNPSEVNKSKEEAATAQAAAAKKERQNVRLREELSTLKLHVDQQKNQLEEQRMQVQRQNEAVEGKQAQVERYKLQLEEQRTKLVEQNTELVELRKAAICGGKEPQSQQISESISEGASIVGPEIMGELFENAKQEAQRYIQAVRTAVNEDAAKKKAEHDRVLATAKREAKERLEAAERERLQIVLDLQQQKERMEQETLVRCRELEQEEKEKLEEAQMATASMKREAAIRLEEAKKREERILARANDKAKKIVDIGKEEFESVRVMITESVERYQDFYQALEDIEECPPFSPRVAESEKVPEYQR